MTPASRVVIVLGDVMTDLVVHASAPFAAASDTRSTIDIRPGGSGANVAAWLADQRVGARRHDAHFVGCVGVDPFGAYHRDDLRRRGVTPHLAVDPSRSTGTVVALIGHAGERSMFPDRGANLGLRRRDIPRDLFQPGACLHLSGYSLFEPDTRDVALAALGLARERGLIISVDPSSAALLEAAGPDRFLEWTRGADLCFPNLDEGRLLSGQTEPAVVARTLCGWYGGVALTLGARGALWSRAGESPIVRAAPLVEAIDTTGAGDAFCAGFLARWLIDANAGEALADGLRLGAMAVTQAGARVRS